MSGWLITTLAAVLLSSCSTLKSPIKTGESSRADVTAVRLFCDFEDHKQNKGTATILPGGAILTSAHVIRGDCIAHIGNRKLERLYVDFELDLAVLGSSTDFTSISCQHAPSSTAVSVIGHPLGSPYLTESHGEVSANFPEDGAQWSFGFAEVGMSGGPVFTEEDRSQVAGILKAKNDEGSAFLYVHGPAICEALSQIEDAELPEGRDPWPIPK